MKQVKRLLLIVLCHFVGLTLLVIIGAICGIRVVCNQDMDIDWTAVTAIGTWSTAIVPIFIVFLTAHVSSLIEKERENIVQSNLHLYEALQNSDSSASSDAEKLKHLYNYISIGLVATTEELSERMKLDETETMRLLSHLESIEQIETISNPKYLGNKNQLWRKKTSKIPVGKS